MGTLRFYKIWATASYFVNCAAENDSVRESDQVRTFEQLVDISFLATLKFEYK